MLCQVLVYGEYGRLDQVIEQVKQERGEDMVKVLGRGMRRGFTNRHCPKCNGNIFLDQDDYFDPKESYYGCCGTMAYHSRFISDRLRKAIY